MTVAIILTALAGAAIILVLLGANFNSPGGHVLTAGAAGAFSLSAIIAWLGVLL